MVAPIEKTVDAKGMPLPPIDPNVVVPPRVKLEADRAAQLHAQAYSPQANPPVVTVPVTSSPTVQPVTIVTPAPSQPNDDRASWGVNEWMHQAKSMEGRFKQTQETVQSLQSSLSEVTAALASTQVRQPVNQPPPVTPTPPVPLITKEDVETYGQDFLSVAQRAALQAVQPTLMKLEQDNRRLEQRLQNQANQSIEATLDTEVPNWPQINVSPRFKAWLRLRDVYSRQVRQDLLNQAHKAADAAAVVAFFKGFLAEEEATGSTEFLTNQQPALTAQPATPSVELQTLAAPGHAKPATGTQPGQSADAPIWITRGQITQFYKNVREGVYAGREQDRMNDEAIIFECQRAGRVR
jgi:hypothetical protein